jgi:hypothetical protein
MARNTSAFLSCVSPARPAGRRVHGDQGQHLRQVVLDHVAERADGVVEPAAVLDAEIFRHRDLHAGHALAVPQFGQRHVGEPEPFVQRWPHHPNQLEFLHARTRRLEQPLVQRDPGQAAIDQEPPDVASHRRFTVQPAGEQLGDG